MSITYSQMKFRIIRTIPNDILHVYYIGMRELTKYEYNIQSNEIQDYQNYTE